jgi:hypothetical protein
VAERVEQLRQAEARIDAKFALGVSLATEKARAQLIAVCRASSCSEIQLRDALDELDEEIERVVEILMTREKAH